MGKRNVDAALARIRTILDNARHPRLASDISHSYEDKYSMAEFLTNTSSASLLNALEVSLGCNTKKLQQMKNWCNENRSVTLRFRSTEKCAFNRKKEYKVESASQNVTEVKSIIGKATITDKVVTKVRDYFWDFEVSYEIIAFSGNNPDDNVELISRVGTYEIKTSSEDTPKPKVRVVDNIDTNFHINRKVETCRTPRRNEDIYSAFNFFRDWNC